ncbi:MAG: hypothetical protein ABMA13_21080 [Chthoniobacteraceae bacterium]
MKPALLLAAGLFATAAHGVDLRAKSTSASKQFTVYCSDTALRARVSGFAEEVKRDVLDLLGERDRWRIPIVVTLEAANAGGSSPVSLRLAQTPDGPTIQLGVSIGDDPAAVHLQKHLIRAVLIDFIHRDHPPKSGEPYAEAPWWIVAGAIEKFRQRDLGVDADVFQRLIQMSKLPAVTDFIAGRGEELGRTAGAFDNACAVALLQLLLDQPGGRPGLVKLLRAWPDAQGDSIRALGRAFPALGHDATSLEKWWTLNLARFAASDRYRGLTAADTDRELQALLEFDVVVDKVGRKERFAVGQFKEFMRLRGAKAAVDAQQKAIVGLSTKANTLLRPVLADYEQVFALLAKGRTRGIAERIHRAEVYRTTVLERKGDIADYLNWFEATQMGGRSGAFDDYFRAVREAEAESKHTTAGAVIAAYLDLLEAEL